MTRLKVPGQGASSFRVKPVTHLEGTYHDRWLDEGKKKIYFLLALFQPGRRKGTKEVPTGLSCPLCAHMRMLM